MGDYSEFYEARDKRARTEVGKRDYKGIPVEQLDTDELRYQLAMGQKATRELNTLRQIVKAGR